MGKTRTGTYRRLIACLLATVSFLGAQDKPSSEKLGFSIRSNDEGQFIWGIKGEDGKLLDLPPEEVRKRLEQEVFPETQRKAEDGTAPQVWAIGFFYLAGVSVEKDLAKAEAAFRKGLEHDSPVGLLTLANHYYHIGSVLRNEREEQAGYFDRAEALFDELLDSGGAQVAGLGVSLASVYLFGWYNAEIDFDRAGEILDRAEKAVPENPSVLLHQSKRYIYLKDYPKAYDYAERAEAKLLEIPNLSKTGLRDLKRAKANKISAAVLNGDISKIDPDEFLEMSKDSLGLNGPLAWAVPVLLILFFAFLLKRSRQAWNAEGSPGPGLWLTIMWVSTSILTAGIGFNIRLPGLDNGVGHWIGAIIVTTFALLAIHFGGRERYFGSGPLYSGPKNLLKGIGIVVGCVVGMQVIAMGYSKVYELILDRSLDQQLVSLFIKSENLLQLAGTVLIVGIAIPFYEEVFFRGFLYDSLDRKWGAKAALIISSFLFAIVHGITFFVPLLFLSFALGWLRMKTDNLRMSFVLHAANNSTSVLAGYFISSPS
ncbi:MAG: CPBP family intramembrane metalloprotease [Verrucomicrobiales bacterium]|nr:CPBP family intramembrane metalloprotease [Verrucomicrobiales bacterium]